MGEGSGPGAVLGPFPPRGAVKQEAGMPAVAQASSYSLIPPTVVHSSYPVWGPLTSLPPLSSTHFSPPLEFKFLPYAPFIVLFHVALSCHF